jgi:hypothetical protein
MIDLLDVAANAEPSIELRQHLESCPRCGQEFQDLRQTLDSLRPSQFMSASPGFKERVMKRALEEKESMEMRTTAKEREMTTVGKTKWWGKPARLALAGGLMVILLIGVSVFNWVGNRQGQGPLAAMNLLAQSVQATSNLVSVHIKARMRTLPRDNFDMIGLDYNFVPIEMWKRFGEPPEWRIEKTGRVIVMDGQSSLMLIKPNHAVKGTRNAGFAMWLTPLLDVDHVLENELQQARQQHSQLHLTEEVVNGGVETVLTIKSVAQGDFRNDWMKNSSIWESDNTRIYRFDTQKRLTKLQVYVQSSGRDVLVFEASQIDYDIPLDASLFALNLPEDVTWYVEPNEMPTPTPGPLLTPKEVAQVFFEACAREDWGKVLEIYPHSSVSQNTKDSLGKLEIVSIGEPFKSGLYPGWFVPYKVKLRSGEVKTWNLAVRNDNPAKRFLLDGGF